MESFQESRILGRTGAIASLALLILIPTQIIIFSIHQPPADAKSWLDLFGRNWLLGLLEMDILYIVDNTLVALIYLALYGMLKASNKTVMRIALLLGFLGIAAYYCSNPAFELWQVQKYYQAASTVADQQKWLTIADSLILQWRGTAFLTYYILNGACLMLISVALLHSELPRKIGIIGLVSGILMSVPSTAGSVGLVFSLLSLIPWMVFLVFLFKPLWHLGNTESHPL